jgi:hypothetical protein
LKGVFYMTPKKQRHTHKKQQGRKKKFVHKSKHATPSTNRPDPHQNAQQDTEERLRALFGQRLSPASGGPGTRILYRCPDCGRPWLLDGAQILLRLEDQQIRQQAFELGADLAHLPTSTCRLCLFRHGLGSFEVDEYGSEGCIGYGINWEAAEPVGAHLQASILAENALSRSPTSPQSHLVSNPRRARAVLTWLSEDEQALMAQVVPPGHGMSGTQGWQWKGAMFRQLCPPLGGIALTMLAIALPPQEPLDLPSLVALWQTMASLALDGRFTGEAPEPTL